MASRKWVIAVTLAFAMPPQVVADDGSAGPAYHALDHCLGYNMDWPENCQNVPYLSCIGSTWASEPDPNKKREMCWIAEMEAWQRVSRHVAHRMEMNLPIDLFAVFKQAEADQAARRAASVSFLDAALDVDDPLTQSYLARTHAIAARNESLRLLDYHTYHQDGLLEQYLEGDR